MAELAAAIRSRGEQVLVLSTGIIGEFLPMEKIEAGIAAAAVLATMKMPDRGARGMLTTDTTHKLAGRSLTLGGRTVQITGMAKGAAMIGPNMATMLGVVLTDATLRTEVAQAALAAAVEDSSIASASKAI